MIGIYDPLIYNFWPWHYHYEDGKYLSAKQRICSETSAAVFSTAHEARVFYHTWKHRDRYKMEVIEVKTWVEEPDPEYPLGHPKEIFNRLARDNVRSCYRLTLLAWLGGYDSLNHMSQSTRLRHRTILLKYGVDIFERPSQSMLDLWNETKSAKSASAEFPEKSKLSVVK